MCSSSELSISSSIPVIFPARLGCIAWIRGNKRSPRKAKVKQMVFVECSEGLCSNYDKEGR